MIGVGRPDIAPCHSAMPIVLAVLEPYRSHATSLYVGASQIQPSTSKPNRIIPANLKIDLIDQQATAADIQAGTWGFSADAISHDIRETIVIARLVIDDLGRLHLVKAHVFEHVGVAFAKLDGVFCRGVTIPFPNHQVSDGVEECIVRSKPIIPIEDEGRAVPWSYNNPAERWPHAVNLRVRLKNKRLVNIVGPLWNLPRLLSLARSINAALQKLMIGHIVKGSGRCKHPPRMKWPGDCRSSGNSSSRGEK